MNSVARRFCRVQRLRAQPICSSRVTSDHASPAFAACFRHRSAHRWAARLILSFLLVLPAFATPVAFEAFPNNSTYSSAAVAQAIANVPTNAGAVFDAIGTTTNYLDVGAATNSRARYYRIRLAP